MLCDMKLQQMAKSAVPTDGNGRQVAVEVAAGLVTAYSELRQLQLLLQSLLDSLTAQQPSTAQDIVCHQKIVTTLQQVSE